MSKTVKFGLLIAGILGTLGWLAVDGISDTKTYYKTIAEVHQMGAQAQVKRIRVAGDMAANSIVRDGTGVRFMLAQDKLRLNVVYNGTDPLPDTFKDGAQALADGKLGADGVFHAIKIQAKCASKYEAKPVDGQAEHHVRNPLRPTRDPHMENIGALAILLAFCFAIYAVVASLVGKWAKRPLLILSAERAVYCVWALLTTAAGMLVYSLIHGDFRLAYVDAHSNLAMPTIYKFTAWWGGRKARCCCGPGCWRRMRPWWCIRTAASSAT